MTQKTNLKFNTLLKLVMLIIFLGSLAGIFLNKKEYRIEMIDGYTDNGSYSELDTIKIYLRFKVKNKRARVIIFNINKMPVDSFLCEADSTKPQVIDAWKNGAGYNLVYNYYCKNLKPGIYLIENKIPFIIKNTTNAEVNIVVPYLNNQTSNAFGGKSFYNYSSTLNRAADTLSLYRVNYLDKYSEMFLPWLNTHYNNRINYITDLDLENKVAVDKTKLLIFYGRLSFISEKTRKNIDDFIDRGGNMLVLSADFINNKVTYNQSNNTISFSANKADQYWNYDRKNPNYLTCGNSYEFNLGKLKSSNIFKGYKVISNTLNLFSETKLNDTLRFNSVLYSSPPLIITNNSINVDTNLLKFYKQEILAYGIGEYGNKTSIGCVFYFQKHKNSGKVINIGNQDFVENINEKQLRSIVIKCIEILKTNTKK